MSFQVCRTEPIRGPSSRPIASSRRNSGTRRHSVVVNGRGLDCTHERHKLLLLRTLQVGGEGGSLQTRFQKPQQNRPFPLKAFRASRFASSDSFPRLASACPHLRILPARCHSKCHSPRMPRREWCTAEIWKGDDLSSAAFTKGRIAYEPSPHQYRTEFARHFRRHAVAGRCGRLGRAGCSHRSAGRTGAEDHEADGAAGGENRRQRATPRTMSRSCGT